MLTSQMIRGDKGGPPAIAVSGISGAGSTVDLSHLMKEHQERMRQEYEGKLADLERERESIEEEKAQVEHLLARSACRLAPGP
jgi:septal ring factor EnvC (AmiA/AmiB activator)